MRRLLAPSAPPLAPERKAKILHAVTRERLGLRAAERTFGVCRQAIAVWIKKSLGPAAPEPDLGRGATR